MRVEVACQRWIDILAGLVISLREAWRARRALSVAIEGKRLVVRRDVAPGGLRDATASPVGSPLAADLAAAARRHFITLELSADETVVERINLPAQAREFLPGIVRNQIERLSPWPADQVVFGFDVAARPGDSGTLDARVLMTSRSIVESARGALAATGLTADRIVAREVGGVDAPPVTLWSRLDSGSGRGRERTRRTVGAVLLATIGVSAASCAWLLASAGALRSDSEAAAARTAVLQRQLQPARESAPSQTADPAERAWILRKSAPSGVMLLEALSRALPDTAYVTELSLQKSTVRIVGLTSDAPSLIAPLEHSGQFAEVRFSAPSTRGPDGRLFWYHIEARVEPHIAEGAP